MAHVPPVKRLEKTAQFIRLATRQIQENTPELAVRTLKNAENEINILSKDGKTNEQLASIIPQLIEWHKNRLDALELLETHADKPIDIGTDSPLLLTPEMVNVFQVAVILCKAIINDFPITLKNGEEPDSEELPS
ncbi:hypothetical protein IM880_13060 [Pectobacterium polaris]|uniref:Uncharacterized protein n=1 Tax=Pectobacterium polaris TaxID=2042057 RepID=A0AAW4P109_9GAMM|nr:hypothetical protein [Pectobacterium polaris]MBW5893145.1 hypothetical protein [Pectobacterium polaris]